MQIGDLKISEFKRDMLKYMQSEKIDLLVKKSTKSESEIIEFFIKELDKIQLNVSDSNVRKVRVSGSDIIEFLAEESEINEAVVIECLVAELGVSRLKIGQGIKLRPYIEIYLNWQAEVSARRDAKKSWLDEFGRNELKVWRFLSEYNDKKLERSLRYNRRGILDNFKRISFYNRSIMRIRSNTLRVKKFYKSEDLEIDKIEVLDAVLFVLERELEGEFRNIEQERIKYYMEVAKVCKKSEQSRYSDK